jgi:hypothetical protein
VEGHLSDPLNDYGTLQANLAMLNLGPNAVIPLSAEPDFPVFIRWYGEGKLKLNDLVTHRYSLDGARPDSRVAGFLSMLNRC